MDARPHSADVPADLIQIIECHWALLCQQWDEMYPANPVAGNEV